MTYLQTQIQNLIRLAGEKSKSDVYYETLEYIKTDGTQYFNPDLLTNADYTIEARFKLTDTSSSSSVFGGRNSSANPMNGNQLHYIYTNGKTQYIGGLSNPELAVADAITLNDVCEVVCDKTGFSIAKNGGTPTKYSKAFSTLQYTTDLMLCATYTKTGDAIQWGFRGELYTFKIRLNGELIRDYVPALDNKMRPCLYDKVTKTFVYAKKISGGAETYDLGFKRWNKFDVDYIENTGEGSATATATQYINTGVIPKGTIISGKIKYCYLDTPVTEAILGGTTADNTSNVRIGTLSGKYRLKWNSTGYTGATSITAGTILEDEFNTDTGFYTNDEQVITQQYTSVAGCINPILLFTDTTTGTNLGYNKVSKRLYYCTIYQDGVLVRDYKPVIWHNGDTTAEACLYDEVYNKMYTNAGTGSFKAYIGNITMPYALAQHEGMDIQLGAGAYINASGVVTNDTVSCYTKAIPVSAGDVITLTVTGRATTSVFNKRIHAYTADDGTISVGSKGSWVSQLGFITFPIGQTYYTTQTLSVTIPSGVNYIRLSHALKTADDIILETQCDLTIVRPYEVGMYVQTLKNSATANAGYVIELNEYPQDGMGYHIKTTTTSDNSNYLFGSRKTTSGNLQIATLSGSSTNGTILSTVTGTSITWKSNNTDWKRAGTTTYECSIQTYKDGNTYKFNAIGYNYTLDKEADRQTQTYTSSIDSQSDIPMLYFGAFNTLNILYGNNSHYFVEWNLPDTRHTLLPVINTAHTQFCFIDNKSKEIYEFTKVGAPSPASDNVKFKQLDGTIITGTLT